jgi:hypothetical protein
MSTYWHLECISHDPPLVSDDEVSQHTDAYLDSARDMWARREELIAIDDVLRGSPTWSGIQFDTSFDRNAWRFIRQHAKCQVQLRNEYGDVIPIERVTDEEPDPPKPPPGQVTMQNLGRGSGKTLGSQQIITDMVQHHIDLYGLAIEYVYDDGVIGLLDPTKAKLHFGGFDMVEARKFIEQLARGEMDDMPMRIDMHRRAKKIMGGKG